jgi:hypothetical protein
MAPADWTAQASKAEAGSYAGAADLGKPLLSVAGARLDRMDSSDDEHGVGSGPLPGGEDEQPVLTLLEVCDCLPVEGKV